MGANGASNSGGGNSYSNAQKARKASVPGTKIGFKGTYKSDINPNDDTDAKVSLFENQGATDIENLKTPPSVTLLKSPLKKGSVVNRKYFRENVLGKGAYKGTTQAEFDAMSRAGQESLYGGYMEGRTSGRTDAYGREISQTDRGGNGGGAIGTSGQVVQAPQPMVAPTTAEVSQVSAAEAQEDITLRKKRILAKGRSPTIQTGPKGASGDLTLGKPSLLGR